MKIVKNSILALVFLLSLVISTKTLGRQIVNGMDLQKCPECPNGKPAPINQHFYSHLHEWPLFHCDQIRKMRKRLQELEKENKLMREKIAYIIKIIGESDADE